MASGRMAAAEALVRWQHPERALVSPLDFIPVAEETGQVEEIGEHVLRQACRQVATWNRLGHRLQVSVNVAARQVTSGRLVRQVRSALREAGIAPAQLCLEITVGVLVQASGPGATVLGELGTRDPGQR